MAPQLGTDLDDGDSMLIVFLNPYCAGVLRFRRSDCFFGHFLTATDTPCNSKLAVESIQVYLWSDPYAWPSTAPFKEVFKSITNQ
jgi:hypothetical protein